VPVLTQSIGSLLLLDWEHCVYTVEYRDDTLIYTVLYVACSGDYLGFSTPSSGDFASL